MSSQESQEKIDAVLDAALDDLDDEDDEDEQQHEARPSTVPSSSPQQGSSGRPVQGPQPSPTGPSSEMDGIDAMMKQFLQMGDEGGDPDEFMGRFLQEMQSQIGAELGNLDSNLPTPSTGKKSSADKNQKDSSSASKKSPDKQSTAAQNESQSNKGGNKSGNNDVDQAIASLIEGMSKQSSLDDDDAGGGDFAGEDEMIKNLMGQFRDGHDDDTNADALIDGMMEQLLSKDLMYEPMKKVAEKFPDWLEQNRGNLPSQEYEQ